MTKWTFCPRTDAIHPGWQLIGKMEFEISFGDPKHRIPFFEWVHEYKCIIGKQKWKRKLREEVRISLSNLEEIENKNENEILFSDFVEKRLYVHALWAHQMHNSVDNLRDLQSGFRLPRTSECISMQTRNNHAVDSSNHEPKRYCICIIKSLQLYQKYSCRESDLASNTKNK